MFLPLGPIRSSFQEVLGMKFLPTALLGNDNTSLSCIGPLLKCLTIHLGNPKSRQSVPIYHSCLLEMPRFPEIMIVAYLSLLTYGERNSLENCKGHLIINQKIFTLASILPVTSVWPWTSKFTATTIINFYFWSSLYLLDAMVRIPHLLPYVILTSFKDSIYHHHFTDKKT